MVKDFIALNHNYSRSDLDFFPIIRKEDLYPDPGEKITLSLQYIDIKAEIVFKIKRKLDEIPSSLLCFETNSESRHDAKKILESSFRKKIGPDEELVILFIKKKP